MPELCVHGACLHVHLLGRFLDDIGCDFKAKTAPASGEDIVIFKGMKRGQKQILHDASSHSPLDRFAFSWYRNAECFCEEGFRLSKRWIGNGLLIMGDMIWGAAFVDQTLGRY